MSLNQTAALIGRFSPRLKYLESENRTMRHKAMVNIITYILTNKHVTVVNNDNVSSCQTNKQVT